MAISGIQVSIRNTPVGCAQINDDGTIELTLNASEDGKELLAGLEKGHYASVAILPIRTPAARASEFKGYQGSSRPLKNSRRLFD